MSWLFKYLRKMSIATLNRIVRETTVFYNTKRERDGVSIPIKNEVYTKWTTDEIKILRENSYLSYSELATLMGRTYYSIRGKMERMQPG